MSLFDKVVQSQNARVASAQARTIAVLLPDLCNIQPANLDNKTVNRYGIEEGDEPSLRTYNGNADIPCRADAQRSFRPEELDYQASQVDEVDLHLPHDVTIAETDIVILNSNKYKIRKLVDDSEWDLTKIVKIMRVTATGVLS